MVGKDLIMATLFGSGGGSSGSGGGGAAALQSKTATPTKEVQSIVPDAGYDGLSDVTVGAIPAEYVSTTDATASADDILSGLTAYVKGEKVIGKLVAGEGAKIEIQSISPNTDIHSGNKYTLSHSLGVIPNLVIVVWNDTSSLAANLMKFGGVYVIKKSGGEYRIATFCSFLNASTTDKQYASVANYTKMSFSNTSSPISAATENNVILCACETSSIPKMLAGKTYQVLIGKV